MELFDLHCDTIYESLARGTDISNSKLHITPRKFSGFSPYIQCFAICVPEEITGDKATAMFKEAYKHLAAQCRKFNIKLIENYGDIKSIVKNGTRGAVFTVENASVLAGKIENISLLKKYCVKFVALTWNGRNELGAGAGVAHSNGITKFGIDVVKQLEKNNITIDLSHASDRLFYDVVNNTSKPLAATHSNSRAVTNVRRNLTDEQFKIIMKRKGIVGLNFHRAFLNNREEEASKIDLLRHAEHFLSLGGENVLSLGADFDGCRLPRDIKGQESMGEIYELFLRENYSESLVKKIFFKNALDFCENFDK